MAVPSAPTITKLQDMGGGRIAVSLFCPDPVTGYKIYRDTTTDPTTLRVTDTTPVVEQAFDNVTPGALYYYRAKATNSDGDSGFSANVHIDAGSGLVNTGARVLPPGGTTGQVLTKVSDADYDVEWADPA